MFPILLICGLGLLAYSNTFSSSFHFDDEPFIIFNPAIRDLGNVPAIWHFFHSRFLPFLSLAFNYHFSGLDVFGYHVFNLMVHLMTALLIWRLVFLTLSTPVMKKERISQHADLIALSAGLLFVSHPLAIEAVTNIWQRATSMAALFYLASLCLYIKSRLTTTPPGGEAVYYIGSLAAAVAAMFCKENAATLGIVVVLYEYTFFEKKQGWKPLMPFLLTLFIIPVTLLFIKTQTFQDMHGDLRRPGGPVTTLSYMLTQTRVMLTYIRLAFVPVNQNFDYDYPLFRSILEPPVLMSFLALIVILYGALRLFPKYRILSFSILWFFITLLPESSLWPMGDVILEHRLYLPLAGYCLFLPGVLYYLFEKKMMIKFLAVILIINTVLTYQRNKVWATEFTLWNDAVGKSPQKARPYNNRGNEYLKQGDYASALADFNKALALDPDYANAYYNRGLAFSKEGHLTQALSDYDKAIGLNPQYAKAYNNRGNIYYHQGLFLKAIDDYNRALATDPHNLQAANNRIFAYLELKQFDTARDLARQAEVSGMAVDPKSLAILKEFGKI